MEMPKTLEKLTQQETYSKEDVAYILFILSMKVDESACYRIYDLVKDLKLPKSA